MATIQKEIRKRSFIGKLIKWTFILFNLIMAFWLFSYWGSLGDISNQAGSNAERTGVAIGGTMGSGLIIFVWLAGAVILGIITMLTRGQRLLISEDQ